MDIKEQEQTYGGFLTATKYGLGLVVVILLILASIA